MWRVHHTVVISVEGAPHCGDQCGGCTTLRLISVEVHHTVVISVEGAPHCEVDQCGGCTTLWGEGLISVEGAPHCVKG